MATWALGEEEPEDQKQADCRICLAPPGEHQEWCTEADADTRDF